MCEREIDHCIFLFGQNSMKIDWGRVPVLQLAKRASVLPAEVERPPQPQPSQHPLQANTAAVAGLLDAVENLFLLFGAESAFVDYSPKVLFNSWFSAVISAITDFIRTVSESRATRKGT
jgi:hypothetical protein